MIIQPTAEVCDRYTILRLKSERGGAGAHVCDKEYERYRAEVLILVNKGTVSSDLIDELYRINGEIWSLEADLRAGRDDKLGLYEIGRRALAIRDFNRQRIQLKNKISQLNNEDIVEHKTNHSSE